MDLFKLSKILNFNIATLIMKHYTYKKISNYTKIHGQWLTWNWIVNIRNQIRDWW